MSLPDDGGIFLKCDCVRSPLSIAPSLGWPCPIVNRKAADRRKGAAARSNESYAQAVIKQAVAIASLAAVLKAKGLVWHVDSFLF